MFPSGMTGKRRTKAGWMRGQSRWPPARQHASIVPNRLPAKIIISMETINGLYGDA
jgi:hypothetical protein